MNGNPKVSVIVPIYKAESYLYKCIDSLLTQTLADIEILLIDDGSPDGSGMICDEYARKDSRVKVFHKSNGGVASARQCGLDHACGEYVIHADPDDWVESDMLQSLYEKAVEEDADMVICDFYYEIDETEGYVRVCQQPETLDHMTVLKNLFQQLHGSCWNKLLRRVCCSKYNVHFDLNLSFAKICISMLRCCFIRLELLIYLGLFIIMYKILILNHCHLAIIKVVSNMIEC